MSDHEPAWISHRAFHEAGRWAYAGVAGFVIGVAALCMAVTELNPAVRHRVPIHLEGKELLQLTNLLDVHLAFTTDHWEGMEPRGGMGPFGPARRPDGVNPASRRANAGFPEPRGPMAFGPSMILSPMFARGDENGDGRLSLSEFSTLGESWFKAWDTNRSGSLDLAKIRRGLNATMSLPGPLNAGAPMQPGFPGGAAGPQRDAFRPDRGAAGGQPPNMLLGAEGKRNGLASAMGVEFPTAIADLEVDGTHLPSVSVRYKGNGTFMASRQSVKRSMKIDLNDHVAGRRLGGATKLNLHNCVTDPSWMNEVLSHKLFRDAGVPAPRTAFARVHLTVPGKYDRQYLGLYSIVENVDNRFALDRFGSKKGALFKPVTRQLFEDLGMDWAAYRQSYDPKTPVSAEETGRVISFCQLVSHASDNEFAARLEGFLDLDAFARFMAVTTWLSTMDSILGVGQNFYVYLHPVTHRFHFIPWDLDHSFGQFTMVGTQEQRENLNIRHPWDNNVLFLERIFKVDAFQRRYLAVMREFQRTIFRPERLQAQVDQLAAVLRPAVAEESAEALQRFDQVTSGRPPEPSAMGGFGPPGGFGPSVQPIKPFVVARAKSVADQLAGKSAGMQATRGGPFGGPGGPGGFGGPGGPGRQAGPFGGAGGPGPGFAPGDFGPGMFLAPAWLNALDKDQSGDVSAAEWRQVLNDWFGGWNRDADPELSEAELEAGIDKDLAPTRGGMPGFGPPPSDFGPPPSP